MAPLPNTRHERFCQAIVEGKAVDEAYAFAGYARNYANAARLAKTSHVLTRIDELRTTIAYRHDMTADRLMGAYIEIVEFDPRSLFKWDKNGTCVVRASDELTPQVARMVESIEVKKDGSLKLKWAKRTDALDQIGRMIGAFKDKLEVKDVTPREDDASNIELARRAAFMLGRAVERMSSQQQPRVIDAATVDAGSEPV